MLSKLGCLLFALAFGNSFCSSRDDLPEIDTPLGRVRGYWKTLEGLTYAAFEGIPYAKPPVGDLRFEEPEPIEAWSETWEANTLHTCIQADTRTPGKMSGEEDCLYMNVYIPEDSVNNTKVDKLCRFKLNLHNFGLKMDVPVDGLWRGLLDFEVDVQKDIRGLK